MNGNYNIISHMPVMLPEVLEGLEVARGKTFIDATCGEGGHSLSIATAIGSRGSLLGIDADSEAIFIAKNRLHDFLGKTFFTNISNFRNIYTTARQSGFKKVNGILFDLGISSRHIEKSKKGFTFQLEQPLDMRFSNEQALTAADILNSSSFIELCKIIYNYGDEKSANRITSAIISKRPIKTTTELAEIIDKSIPYAFKKSKRIHPATKTFQALRIAVNNELLALEEALNASLRLLDDGGKLAVITYHSHEDRIVKHFFSKHSQICSCPPGLLECVCNRKPCLIVSNKRGSIPTKNEIEFNNRSRSARLRIATYLERKSSNKELM